MRRRVSVRRRLDAGGGTHALLVAALALILVLLGLFALLRPSFGPSEDAGGRKDEPVRESAFQETAEEAVRGGAVVRVSGTEGTFYEGTYGTPQEVSIGTDTVGTEPADYEVNIEEDEE